MKENLIESFFCLVNEKEKAKSVLREVVSFFFLLASHSNESTMTQVRKNRNRSSCLGGKPAMRRWIANPFRSRE